MKINLEIKPWPPLLEQPLHITQSLPFFQNKPGGYVHRPRNAMIHKHHGVCTHVSVSFWCGGNGFPGSQRLNRQGRFLDKVPDGEQVCAVCEGKAIGAGLIAAGTINGKPVIYAPRHKRRKQPQEPKFSI